MDFQFVDTGDIFALCATATCSHQELGPVIGQLFQSIIEKNPDAELQSPPRIYYPRFGETDCDIEAALEVDPTVPLAAGSQAKTFPGANCLMCTHVGSYDTLSDSWMALMQHVSDLGMTVSGVPYDLYVTDPGEEPDPSKWVTELYVPVRQ